MTYRPSYEIFGITTPLEATFQVRDKSTINRTDPLLLAWVLQGIVPSSWLQCTQNIVGNKRGADKIIDRVMSIFIQRGQREIWAQRLTGKWKEKVLKE